MNNKASSLLNSRVFFVFLTILTTLISQSGFSNSEGFNISTEQLQNAKDNLRQRQNDNSSERSQEQSPRARFAFEKYTLEDLEVLESHRDYREFLDHAMDIRPSQRKEPWASMVQNMASGYIEFLIQRQNYSQDTFNYLEELTTWPVLRDHEYFHTRWQRYAIRSAKKCIEQSQTTDQCVSRLQLLWNSTHRNPELGLQVGQLLSQIKSGADLWEYYRYSAQSSVVAQYHCSKADIKRWAFRKIHHKIEQHNLHTDELKKLIQSKLHQDCWDHLKKDLRRVMHGPRPQQISAFLMLESMDEMTLAEEDFFLVRYYLEGAEIGRIFNLSWARLETLAQNRDRREKVLERLLSLDPLPGAIFVAKSETQKERREILLNHFSEHFPEYLDSYGRTCLNYRQGEGLFPRGNPTMECQELFQAQKESESNWINQGLRLRYSAPQRR